MKLTTGKEYDTWFAYANAKWFGEVGFTRSEISLEDALKKLAELLAQKLENVYEVVTKHN